MCVCTPRQNNIKSYACDVSYFTLVISSDNVNFFNNNIIIKISFVEAYYNKRLYVITPPRPRAHLVPKASQIRNQCVDVSGVRFTLFTNLPIIVFV